MNLDDVIFFEDLMVAAEEHCGAYFISELFFDFPGKREVRRSLDQYKFTGLM